ncbi:phage/plasmid primase, P4 family [Sphingosinicella sp. YJ22]|uniref:phage/plasmid primase, P4 family n=1 Tax=Sphingosinicella sp. YJ22 TaxID=1104780 RepID=UPI00140DDDA7|nr:phage/plasmid primase, P4 family [Sphingosinicella sp. YJ22]
MNNAIFEAFAPIYWAAGLPVIPLRERNKMPDINQWSIFGTRMPTELEQQHWLASYPRGNIGLPFGQASGLCAIDIDTEDEALTAAIIEACGPAPWVRVGKKGMGLVYRWEGQRNFKLRGADGGMICEFLGQGNQMVMPPSIHPETQRPYTANANLWEILDQIPELGEDIEEKLRGVLSKKGFELGSGGRSSPIDVIPSGERDVMMVRHAGYLARVVLGIDRSASFSLWDAIQQMYHWVEAFTAKVTGDAMDPQKGVAKLLEFLIKDLEKGKTMPNGWDANLPDEWREHPSVVRADALNREQRWTLTRAREWFDQRILEHPACDDWVATAVQEVLTLVARDDRFPESHEDGLFSHLVRHCKQMGYAKRDLARILTNARKGLKQGEAENHGAVAAQVLEELQRSAAIRYDHGQFWQWTGSSFAKLDEDAIYMHVAENVTTSALVRRNSDYRAIVDVLRRMCKEPLAQVDKRGINFANGFVGEDLAVLDHDPRYGATFTLPFEYHQNNAARCNRWLEFLANCWGREDDFDDRVLALQEMFAATLFGLSTHYQRAFLLFGRAGTGKTQILKVLRAMLPPDATAELGPDQWGERFTLTDLVGKVANICGELPENGMITGNVFKEVVEGSPIRGEFKGKDGFVFVPKCAHWFASNYLPMSRDSTRGFVRRWLILDFNHPVREEDKMENLAEIIVAEEREAIAAWALEGLRRLLDQRGYTLPACHERRLNQVRRINNSVQAFLDDANNVRRAPDGEMKCRDLYDLYSFHMRDVRNAPVSYERFRQMLEDLDLNLEPDLIGDYVVQGVVRVERIRAAA